MPQIYRNFQQFATPSLEGWRKTRKTNFLLLALKLLLKRTCCLAHLTRALPFEIGAQSKVDRLFRFLEKEKAILPEDFFAKMGLWVLSLFDHKESLVLVLDATFVKGWLIFFGDFNLKGKGFGLKDGCLSPL